MCSDNYDPSVPQYPKSQFTQEQGVSLEKYMVDLLKCCQLNCIDKFESRDRDVTSSYAKMEKRLDGMNEFRDTLKDQAGRFVTRTELLAAVAGISTIISIIISILMRVMK